MKVEFSCTIPAGRVIEAVMHCMTVGNGPLERGDTNRLAILVAISGWANGVKYPPYKWEETDSSFPVDNGVQINGDTLRMWVSRSSVDVRLEEGKYFIIVNGARHSLEVNPTGQLAGWFLSASESHGGPQGLVVESQANQAWDLQPGRLFKPTLVAEVRRALAPLDRICSAKISAARETFLAALADPEASNEHATWLKELATRNEFVEVREEA